MAELTNPAPSSPSKGIRTRPRRRQAGLAAGALAAGVLVGCGGGDPPRIARGDAAPLIALSAQIAHEGRCAQARDIAALKARSAALVGADRVPPRLRQALVRGVAQLAAQAPVCVPRVAPVPTERLEPVATPPSGGRGEPTPPAHSQPHGHGHGRGHGRGNGHDKEQ